MLNSPGQHLKKRLTRITTSRSRKSCSKPHVLYQRKITKPLTTAKNEANSSRRLPLSSIAALTRVLLKAKRVPKAGRESDMDVEIFSLLCFANRLSWTRK